jgi:branched-subunit amino acid aminotransferase/4-amino-4-deoxychorismate lyase
MNIILDGQAAWIDAVALKRLTPGLRDRDGAFETLLLRRGVPANLDAHYGRLCSGLNRLGIAVPWTKGALSQYVAAAQEVCAAPMSKKSDLWRVRVMVWRAGGQDHWAVIPAPYAFPSALEYKYGVVAGIVMSAYRFEETDGHFKSLKYSVYRKAMDAARAQGCFEALLVDLRGQIIDGSRTSVVILKDEEVISAPAGYGTLEGTVQRKVLALAREAGLRTARRPVLLRDVFEAQAVWLTNALIGMIPVSALKTLPGRRS